MSSYVAERVHLRLTWGNIGRGSCACVCVNITWNFRNSVYIAKYLVSTVQHISLPVPHKLLFFAFSFLDRDKGGHGVCM